jgi:ABC-type sugar transport system ATPase subunit
MTALVLDGVVKRFGDFIAVDDLSFSVPDGGAFGFLGGNGVLLVAFLALEFAVIGRIFESNNLSARQPPTWNAIARMVLRKKNWRHDNNSGIVRGFGNADRAGSKG